MFKLSLLVLSRYRMKLSSTKSFSVGINKQIHIKLLRSFTDETCD